MNQIHGMYPRISNDDYVYVLTQFVVQPKRLIDRRALARGYCPLAGRLSCLLATTTPSPTRTPRGPLGPPPPTPPTPAAPAPTDAARGRHRP
jgi:hypothetical protein